MYIYYRRFPDNSLKIKGLVAFVCLSEVAHAICLGHALSLPAVIFLTGFVGPFVEAFFAFRIYALSKKLYIPIFSWIMSCVCVVGANVIVQSRVATINDLTVTTTLLVILVCERSNAYKKTVALMDKLIMYTIESGMLMSVSRIATLTCLVAMKDNLIWLTTLRSAGDLFPTPSWLGELRQTETY
ncbi:hypothetical protein B0H14DRAFT_3896171, partial [Mycena olivaceomarginata]